MPRMTAEEFQEHYGWDEATALEMVTLLENVTDEEIDGGGLAQPTPPDPNGVPHPDEWTPARIREVVQSEFALEQAGKLIEQAREKRGLSTRELALKVGVSQPRVIQVQNAGETLNLTTLVKFAGALGYRLRLEFVPEEGGESLKTL